MATPGSGRTRRRGLDDYGARYYDSTIGQFTSADTVLDGLNRYGYVGGNPISRTDPSGHVIVPHPPMEGGDVYAATLQSLVPTPAARGVIPSPSGADELTRALHQPQGISLDSMPS